MKKLSLIILILGICFVFVCLGVKIHENSFRLPAPFFWMDLEKAIDEKQSEVPALSLLPSWFVRYAVYRNRFGGLEFLTTEEVLDGNILPYSKVWLVDVNGKFITYQDALKGNYRIEKLFDVQGAQCYELTAHVKVRTVFSLAHLLESPGTHTLVTDKYGSQKPEISWQIERQKKIFAGYPRYVYMVPAEAFLRHRIIIQKPPKFNIVKIVAGLDDVELNRSKLDSSETLISLYVDDNLIKKISVMNLLGLQYFDINIRDFGDIERLTLEFQAVKGLRRVCSFNLFLVE